MSEEDKLRHYDMTKHTRYEELTAGVWVCLDCREIALLDFGAACDF